MDDKPLVIEEIKERIKLRVNQLYDQTITNVKHFQFKVPEMTPEIKHDMELLQLAFFNSIAGTNYTWNEAKTIKDASKAAMMEASQMRQAFVKECVEQQGAEIFKKITGGK